MHSAPSAGSSLKVERGTKISYPTPAASTIAVADVLEMFFSKRVPLTNAITEKPLFYDGYGGAAGDEGKEFFHLGVSHPHTTGAGLRAEGGFVPSAMDAIARSNNPKQDMQPLPKVDTFQKFLLDLES